jgi:hypothetical protein
MHLKKPSFRRTDFSLGWTHKSDSLPNFGVNKNHNGSKAKPTKNTKNTRRTQRPRTVRQPHADCPPLMDRTKNCSTPKVNSPNSSPDLPNGRSC